MGQKSEPPGFEQVYVLGLDHRGDPRGARFTVLRDSIVSAAMDMKWCRVLIRQPETVCVLAKRLPVGRVVGTGQVVKLVVPNISRELYKKILRLERIAAEQEKARMEAPDTIH